MSLFRDHEERKQTGIRLEANILKKIKELKSKYHVSCEHIVNSILSDYFERSEKYEANKRKESKGE